MGKVLKFGDENIVTLLVELLEMAKTGELTSLLVAGKCSDGNIISGRSNAPLTHRQELIGHMQIDVMAGVMEKNYCLERDED